MRTLDRWTVVAGLICLPLAGCASDGSEEGDEEMVKMEANHDEMSSEEDESLTLLEEVNDDENASESVGEDGDMSSDGSGAAGTEAGDLGAEGISELEGAFSSKATVKSWALAVRAQPNKNARVVRYLRHADEVNVIEERSDGWTRIEGNHFVRSNFLKTDHEQDAGEGQDTHQVRSRALYIRSNPHYQATVVGVLLEGERIRVHETKAGWSKIGPRRFVRARYLKPLGH